MMKMLMFMMLVALFSCTPQYAIHPGSANVFDSTAYDALQSAQVVIDTARQQLTTGALTASIKPQLNALIAAYDTAMPAWKIYHNAAVAGGTPPDLATLQTNLNNLAAALAAFQKGK
jgi:hypothetical protein